jgi:membrane protein
VFDGAAVLAFYFLLAVFPAAIIVLSLLPSLSIPHLQQAMLELLHQVLPQQSANFFEVTVRYVATESSEGLLTFGLIFMLWSASSGVYAVMEQLNVVHDVKDRRRFWKARGTAILLMLFFVVLWIGALSLVIFGGVVQSWVASMIGWSQPLLIFFATLRWIILAAALLLALAVAYRYGPDAGVRFRYISPGNVVAAVLIALASIGFRFYVSEFGNYSAMYGNLAAMIILILWMYMAGIALLVGCEIDTILCRRGVQECGTKDSELGS